MPQDAAAPEKTYLTDYVFVPELFTPEECLEIIYADIPATQAQVVRFVSKSSHELELEQRNTKVKAMPQLIKYRWIYERVTQKVNELNRDFYRFDLKELTDFQILEYENTGFYNTHVDIGTGDTSVRKLSMVLFLTDPSEYGGGELILKPNYPPFERTQGCAVFFPAYIPHEIRPVTWGLRHTMVTWVLGPCFK